MDVEWWKSLFEVGGVILLFLTFAFGAGFMLTGKKVSDRQSERLRKFDSDLTAAKSDLAKQQDRAAKSEGNIALAEQHAAEANTKAEGFRLNIAKANEESAKAQAQVAGATAEAAKASAKAEEFRLDIAQANQRAAEANRVAEQERLERMQLEARLADRVVTPEQKNRLRAAFAPLKGKTIDVVIFGDTPEISLVAGAISKSMNDEGVLVNEIHPMGATARGVTVGVKSDAPDEFKRAATEMIAILRETLDGGAGPWDFNAMDLSQAVASMGNSPGAAPVWTSPLRVFIGSK